MQHRFVSRDIGMDHECDFPEVKVGRDSADGDVLREKDLVLTPCRGCGASPLEAIDYLGFELDQTARAFAQLILDRDLVLFHWSPRSRRKQIERYGLLPHRRPTITSGDAEGLQRWKAPYVCFGDDARWSWALSGAMPHAPRNTAWDLWQTYATKLEMPYVLAGDHQTGNGIHEVRTRHRVFKRSLFWIGERST